MAEKIIIYNDKDISRIVKEEINKELFDIHKLLDRIQIKLIDLERIKKSKW